MLKTLCSLTCTLLLAATIAGADTDQNNHSELWLVELDARELGPLRFELDVSVSDGNVRATSKSGLFAFEAVQQPDGVYVGQVLAPNDGGEIQFRATNEVISGKINAAPIVGEFQATRGIDTTEARDYSLLLESFDQIVAANIYAPTELESKVYRAFRKELQQVAEAANDDLDMLLGFQSAWGEGAFSHFGLRRSVRPAADMITYFEGMRVGFEAATVEFSGDIATLKVRTMMGADTIEQIQAAFQRIAQEQPSTLIVDLRGNKGGAFAVKPLVEHIVDQSLTAGYFLSQNWNRSNHMLPTASEVRATDPWQGWSIIDFYRAVSESELIRVQFNPAEPNFDGQVFVLIDNKVASAAEMAADALSASGLATIIGETSAGEMLSQSMFDIGDGFIVNLPVADYYSFANGRIEGVGVTVDVQVKPADALDQAKRMAL